MRYYLHIPFCRQRCTYCRFALDPKPTEAKVVKYLAHLIGETAEALRIHDTDESDFPIETIYLGGGTPSILTRKQLGLILDIFPVSQRDPNIEITIECNPEDITREYAEDLKTLGCTRISLGVQTMNDQGLKTIGRSVSQATLEALGYLRDARHTNISIDLILGLPDVGNGEILGAIRSLHEQYSSIIKHTSVYFLEYEHTYPKGWATRSLSREAQYIEYSDIITYLKSQEFDQYEISNFAKPGYASRHNMGYWDHSNVLGLGLSAASYTRGKRYQNASTFLEYYRGVLSLDEELTPEDVRIEKIMFGLRTFSLDPSLSTPSQIQAYLDKGLLQIQEGKVSPTLPGIFELDHIISGLI